MLRCSLQKEVNIVEDSQFICIDLKSYYASVECVDRGLDPMTTNLVVADPERSKNTICLAITPAMKKLGVKNRCRLGEIPSNLEYIIASPRMQRYIDISADIYSIYLKYIAPSDIHVYSIDEAFMDVTPYRTLYNRSAKDIGKMIMTDILENTGIRSTCGVADNLYLCKVALDILAKHSPDFIGCLDERSYCNLLWEHQPLTDFWRIGPGTQRRLAKYGIFTMGQIVNTDTEFLYRLFGIDAELLIDHAWGREPVSMQDIKDYKPKANSLSSGQVLMRDYTYNEGKLVAKEMMDLLSLDMVVKNLVTVSISLYVGYSRSESKDSAKGTLKLHQETNADSELIPAVEKLYEQIVDQHTPIRRISVSCNHVIAEECRQYTFFEDPAEVEKARKLQQAVAAVKLKYGKNLILKGMDFEDGATTRERNCQIGGHRSG